MNLSLQPGANYWYSHCRIITHDVTIMYSWTSIHYGSKVIHSSLKAWLRELSYAHASGRNGMRLRTKGGGNDISMVSSPDLELRPGPPRYGSKPLVSIINPIAEHYACPQIIIVIVSNFCLQFPYKDCMCSSRLSIVQTNC